MLVILLIFGREMEEDANSTDREIWLMWERSKFRVCELLLEFISTREDLYRD